MAGPFVTGGVNIPLSLRIAELQRNMATAKKELESLGVKTQQVAVQTQKAAAGTQKALATSGKAVSSFATKVGNAGVRLLSLQLILQQFGSRAGTGKFGKEVRAASDALTAFVVGVAVIPGPIGVAIGAIGALTVAIIQLNQETEKIQKVIDRTNKSVEEAEAAITQFRKGAVQLTTAALIRWRLEQDKVLTAGVPRIREQTTALEEQEKAIQEIVLQTRLQVALQDKLSIQGDKLSKKQQQDLKSRIFTSQQEVKALIAKAKAEDQNRLKEIEANKQLREAIRIQAEFQAAVDMTGEALKRNEEALQEGFITPTEAAANKVKILTDQVVALNKATAQQKSAAGNFAKLLPLATVEDPRGRLDTAAAEKAALELPAKLDAEFQASFSEPFGQALGQATFDGILQGKEAMAIVADIGQNLFANFLAQTIENFQSGMIGAFKSIAGQGGEILGNVLTGLVGLAGFFLSDRGKKGSEQTFEGVQSAIESSQAVRGIVAGPTNVAIAAVGDDLRRALAPSQALLEAQLRELIAIRTNTSGAGGAGGGVPFAGSVATS
jgi:hypothetical protein